MNPELDQDVLNFENTFYNCVKNEKKDLKNLLLGCEITKSTIINGSFEFSYYYETNTFTPATYTDANLQCYAALEYIFELQPWYFEVSSCAELKQELIGMLGQMQTYFAFIDDATEPEIIGSKPFMVKLNQNFKDMQTNIGTICDYYLAQ